MKRSPHLEVPLEYLLILCQVGVAIDLWCAVGARQDTLLCDRNVPIVCVRTFPGEFAHVEEEGRGEDGEGDRWLERLAGLVWQRLLN